MRGSSHQRLWPTQLGSEPMDLRLGVREAVSWIWQTGNLSERDCDCYSTNLSLMVQASMQISVTASTVLALLVSPHLEGHAACDPGFARS